MMSDQIEEKKKKNLDESNDVFNNMNDDPTYKILSHT